ncbi:MAG: carbohydrate porin [Comamonas sp.]
MQFPPIKLAVCGLISALLASTAMAQSLQEDSTWSNQNPYLTKGENRQSAEPPTTSLGERLRDHGISYQGIVIGALFNNLTTGALPGHVGGQVIFINAVDLDLKKAWNGRGKIHFEGVVFPATYPKSVSGNLGTYASSYLGSDQYPAHETGAPWLSLLTYEDTVLDGRLNFEFGKTNLQRYFFRPNCGMDALCIDPLVKWDGGVPDASTGTLGLRVKYQLVGHTTLEAGVQQLREYTALIRHNGWNPLATDSGTGAFGVLGLGWRDDFSESTHPGDYQLAYYYANTDITDPYYTAQGTSALTTGEAYRTHRGSAGLVFKMQQTLWSAPVPAPGAVPRSVSFFGTLGRSFDPARPVGWEAIAGLVYANPTQGTAPWGHVDQVTLKAAYIRLNESTLLAQRAARVALGGSDELTSPHQFRLELSTTLGLGRYVKLQPAIEYIIHPDSSKSSSSSRIPKSGWIVGAVATVAFGNAH